MQFLDIARGRDWIRTREVADEALQKCILIGFSDRSPGAWTAGPSAATWCMAGAACWPARACAAKHFARGGEVREVEGKDQSCEHRSLACNGR